MNISFFTFISLFCLFLSLPAIGDNNANEVKLESPQITHIRNRNQLVVGVKTDYPPWGFYNSEGEIVGLEVDLARDIAKRLGVDLELKKVTSSNRIRRLEDGSIDLLIATMGDTSNRRKQTGIVEPSYYASGATVVVPKETQLRSWSELYGRSVCLTKNAYFNRDLIERFLLNAKEFEGTLDTMAALQFGACLGWVYDDTALISLLQDKKWNSFKIPLNSIMVNPWAIAVKTSEKETTFGRLVSDAIVDWHRSGTLLALEKKWNIPQSQFLIEQNKLWNKKNDNGEYLCQRLSDGYFPSACLSKKGLGAEDEAGNYLLNQWNINFPPLYDDYSKTTLLEGIGLTLLLSASAIVGSLLLGSLIGVALFKLSKGYQWIAWLLARVNDVFRMTPPLLNLYIVFFGLGGLFALHYGFHFNAMVVAIIIFSLYAGSSNGVLLYQALNAVKQHSANHRLKLLFANAFQQAFEGLNANSVNIVKAVGLASTIAVPELISSSNSIIAEFGSQAEMMTFLLVFYFFIVYFFIFLLNRLERWVKRWHSHPSQEVGS